ncbi:MAG: NAD-dependent protein deacylase [Paraglaciecola sp.]|nr:NAD-dependent protein deacylase [Paraglaciecola sp.]NCT47776.1 NAD-dependent protein deacylase [Paraglaciecola sp.]
MQYSNIVVLTGAGVSAESGLKTFRDNNGLWENHHVEEVATPEGFARNPALVYRFYNERRQQLQSAGVAPNAAHYALADLAKHADITLTLVTQNVDNLHERAGSVEVLHMHGELLSARCLNSQQRVKVTEAFDASDRCQCCHPAHGLRPDIVWFGEMPQYMDQIETALWHCDLFLSIGTSGNVYPAAGFVQLAVSAGAHCVELNLEPSAGQNLFSEHHYGVASKIVPAYLQNLLQN